MSARFSARGHDVDQHLLGAGHGIGHRLDGEDLGTTVGSQDDSSARRAPSASVAHQAADAVPVSRGGPNGQSGVVIRVECDARVMARLGQAAARSTGRRRAELLGAVLGTAP